MTTDIVEWFQGIIPSLIDVHLLRMASALQIGRLVMTKKKIFFGLVRIPRITRGFLEFQVYGFRKLNQPGEVDAYPLNAFSKRI